MENEKKKNKRAPKKTLPSIILAMAIDTILQRNYLQPHFYPLHNLSVPGASSHVSTFVVEVSPLPIAHNQGVFSRLKATYERLEKGQEKKAKVRGGKNHLTLHCWSHQPETIRHVCRAKRHDSYDMQVIQKYKYLYRVRRITSYLQTNNNKSNSFHKRKRLRGDKCRVFWEAELIIIIEAGPY